MHIYLNQKMDKIQVELLKILDIFAIFWIYLINMQVTQLFQLFQTVLCIIDLTFDLVKKVYYNFCIIQVINSFQ